MRRAMQAILLTVLWLGAERGAAAAEAELVRIEHGGLTLNGRLRPGEAGRPVLLILHGTLAHNGMELILALQDQLAERGYGSLAVTLGLGVDDRQGMRDCATPHRHRHTDALDELDAWLAWLDERGRDRIVLLGHSRGGNQVAWHMVEREAPAVVAGVLLAPATFDPEAVAQVYAKVGGAPLAEALAKAGAGERLESVPFLHCAQASVEPASFLSYYAPDERLDTPILLQRVAKPVLVIAAGEDELVPDLAERASTLSTEKVEVVTIEGADHFFLDLYADDAVEAIDSFLTGLP